MYNDFDDFRPGKVEDVPGLENPPETELHHSHFAGAAESMVNAYFQVVRQGIPAESVAAAMLGATVNMYDFFGMRAALPSMLRAIAESIESETPPN